MEKKMNFTYGAELEIPDWNCLKNTQELEKTGAVRNLLDYTIINSSGVSNDPSLRSCIFGGEINTKPTDSIVGQVRHIENILNVIGNYGVNHSQNLHLHIRVPGIKDNIDLLKKYTMWLYFNQEEYCKRFIEPELNRQSSLGIIESEEFTKLRKKFHARRKQSRMRLLYPYEIEQIQKAQNFTEWYEGFKCFSKLSGKVLHFSLHRHFINLLQLQTTDTIEFRFFSFENSLDKIHNAFNLMQATIETMLANRPCSDIPNFELPRGVVFNPQLEDLGVKTKCKKGGTQKDFEKHIEILKYLLRDNIISQDDLGVDLYEAYPGPVPEGELVIKKKKSQVGTQESRKKWLEKNNYTDSKIIETW